MRNSEIFSVCINVFAALAAAGSALIAYITVQRSLHAMKWGANLNLTLPVRLALAESPKLLELHSIDLEALNNDGISAEELVYTLNHFVAGEVYYLMDNQPKVQLTKFRKHFLGNEKVRNIWRKYISQYVLINPSPYTHAIDAYIAQIEIPELLRATPTG